MKRSVVIAVLVIVAAWFAGGWLDEGTPAGAPVSHCERPYGALGQFITVAPDGSSTYGTDGSASHVLICTSNGWQHV